MPIHPPVLYSKNPVRKPGLFKLLLLLILTAFVWPVEPAAQNTNYEVRTGLYMGSQGELPFWFYSNVNGKVDPSGTNFLNELSFNQVLLNDEALSASAGGNAVFRLSDGNSVHFSELYLRAVAYGLELKAGRYRQPLGLNNHELSVGSMMVSHNAIPLPRISISMPDFMNVPLTDGYLQYKGMFSHGWFEEDRQIRSPYLHQKYLYLRLNVGPLSGTGGIVHNAQWAGESSRFGRLPQSFEDYLRMITGMAADAESGAPGGEVVNVIGNSVAAYEFGLSYHHEAFTASLTRLFYLEDKVSTRFRSPWDGVWGINLNFDDDNRWLSALTYEHINTKNQDAKSWELIGRRDYYDNYAYRSGWTYENRTLGIPLILFDGTTITNNVLLGHHAGARGYLTDDLSYRALFTYSRNYGVRNDWVSRIEDSIPNDSDDITPREQFRRDQYSWLLGIDYDLRMVDGLQLNLKLASDFGELYPDNLGVMIGASFGNF